ncbi:MAG: hypothetical protein JWP87_5726 [Labilithrix sp.]|nr:hypothetical protein [Labilithrix sp.]
MSALRAVMLGWLRRVARSPHRDRLVLRGSLLTSAWCPGRPAADVDHLVVEGFEQPEARALVEELLVAPDESTTFDAATVSHTVIWAETPSPGLRTKVVGRDDTGAEALLQIDVGQGDRLVHPPALVSVEGNPPVLAVTPETMFAWKTDGLFEFGHGSWRAKDLYDLWLLDRHVPMNDDALVVAVRAAFESQGMELSVADRFLFTESWGASRGSRRRWESFGRRSGVASTMPEILDAIAQVRRRLVPIFACLGHTKAGASPTEASAAPRSSVPEDASTTKLVVEGSRERVGPSPEDD